MAHISVLLPTAFPDLAHLTILRYASRSFWLMNEPFSRKSFTHRGKIRTPSGTQWLTLPVHSDDKKEPLNLARIDPNIDWANLFKTALELNYRNSIYFDFYEAEFFSDLDTAADFEKLTDVVLFLSNRLFDYLEWDYRPELIHDDASLDSLLQSENPDGVWVEPRSRFYRRRIPNQSEPLINLPEYRQHFDGFRPDCCVLDILFEYGPESFRVFDKLKSPII